MNEKTAFFIYTGIYEYDSIYFVTLCLLSIDSWAPTQSGGAPNYIVKSPFLKSLKKNIELFLTILTKF